MKRAVLSLICALILSALHPVEMCAQNAAAKSGSEVARPAATQQKAKAAPKAKVSAKTSRAKAAQEAKALLTRTGLTREELSAPFATGEVYGPPAPPQAQDNATGLEFDPAPKARPFAKQEQDSPINLRFGSDEVVDPMNKQSVVGKPDPAAATEHIKNMDLKGALEKVGGKAEVQVDILKF